MNSERVVQNLEKTFQRAQGEALSVHAQMQIFEFKMRKAVERMERSKNRLTPSVRQNNDYF